MKSLVFWIFLIYSMFHICDIIILFYSLCQIWKNKIFNKFQIRSLDPQKPPWSKSSDGFVYVPFKFGVTYDGSMHSKFEITWKIAPSACLRCCFIDVYKFRFFRRPKNGTVIDDMLRSLWFSADTGRWVIQTLMKHVEIILASHSVQRRFRVVHSFLGRFAPGENITNGNW